MNVKNVASSITRIFVAVVVTLGLVWLAFFVYSALNQDPTPQERVEILKSDSTYQITYPSAAELWRGEVPAAYLTTGEIEASPPGISYYLGTHESDEEITAFFTNAATSNGWTVFREPTKLQFSNERLRFSFRKTGVGWLSVILYEPAQIKNSPIGEYIPTNGYPTIIEVLLQAECPNYKCPAELL